MPKILLVEDEPDILEVLANLLRAANYDVETAEDGADALLKLKDFTPDLVITDVVMPKVNMKSKEPFSAFLLRNKLITQEKLSAVLQKSVDSRESFIDSLLRVLDRKTLCGALSKYYDIPFLENKAGIDTSYFHLLPENAIRKYKAIPLKAQAKTLTVALIEPDNPFSVEYVQMVSGYMIEVMGILESDYNEVIRLYFAASNIGTTVKDLQIPEVEFLVEETRKEEEKPVIKLVETIRAHAVRLGASDIHLEPQEDSYFVRFRIDGALRTIEILPYNLHAPMVSRIKVMAQMNISERRVPQDGQIRTRLMDRDIDLRISTLPSRYGETLVLRILDKTSFLLGLEQLGLSSGTQIRIEQIISMSSEMFLVTGPTGAGKTTTLYACINKMRSPFTNIVTLEDPIEYELLAGKSREGGITQVQINPKVGLTFVEGLKSILKQDPDVIFVGEMRDKDSAEIAFTASLTRHFVLSSLHTIGSAQSISRLLDMGVEPFLIVSTLKGIVSQRLVRVLCPQCKEPYKPPKKFLEKLPVKVKGDVVFYRPKGCPWCGKTGYRGRRGIYELMEINDELRYLMLSKAPNPEIFKSAKKSGMVTLQKMGLESVIEGHTTVAEVLRVAPHE